MTPALTLTRLARAGLALCLAVAAVEWVAAARAYRQTLPPAAWRALSQHLEGSLGVTEAMSGAAIGEPAPVVLLADRWLGPRGRQAIAALRAPRSVAPHDLYGVAPLIIVSRGGDPWTRELREDWGDRPLPTAESVTEVGPFVVHRFPLADAASTLFDLAEVAVAQPRRIELRDRRGRCRGSRGRWTCKQGGVAAEYAEIAYRPRRCLRFAVEDGAPITVRAAGVVLGDRLRGHLGFSDFNARIRSDAPARVEITIDGRRRATLLISDRQGWAPFEVATEPGAHELEITVTPALSGTWGEAGYDPQPTHAPCLELRALASAAGSPPGEEASP